jgi:hypothetical protein
MMNMRFGLILAVIGAIPLVLVSCQSQKASSVSVPFRLDHNRMLVEAEVQKSDSSWQKASLWVDPGNPDLFLSEEFARSLGIDLSSAAEKTVRGKLEVGLPSGFRIGGLPLDFTGVKAYVLFAPKWLFTTMHNDANLPSTVLRRYQVVFDYPKKQMELAERGKLAPRGTKAEASINDSTGIVQIDAVIDGDSLSFALDIGASYSFTSGDILAKLATRHPDWPHCTGAVGCANIWGYWPEEPVWPVMRLPEIMWGPVRLSEVGMVGLPNFFGNGASVGDWYSQKTARPVAGFLGPNALKNYRIEIDYVNKAVYFEKGAEPDRNDMDIVGLTLQLLPDGNYQVLGVAEKDGKWSVEGVEPGDLLIQVGEFKATGATMGVVVDALRGNPGEIRVLTLERAGKQFKVEAKVERFL